MSRVASPLLAAVIVAVASVGIRADACTPPPKPSPATPLVSLDLSGETMTADTANVSISPIDYGSDVSLTIANATAPRSYGLSIPLSSSETLTALYAGGAAITQTLPTPPGDYSGSEPPPNYQADLDQVHSDTPIETTPDDGSGDIEDDQDPSEYPGGDEVESSTRDGEDIASDALAQVERQIPDGNWVMTAAFDPPRATDARGRAVPVSLVKSSDGLTLSVSPSATAAFPVEVALSYGYDPDSYDPLDSETADTSDSLVKSSSAMAGPAVPSVSAQASANCSGGPEVVVSNSSGWKYLSDAFKRYPASCAVYYISVPPVTNVNPQRPRNRSAQKITALNKKVTRKGSKNYPHWNTSDAWFTPVAEINYGKISGDYQSIGRTFGSRARALGYGIWSIDEFPCDLVRKNPTSGAWDNVVTLVQGLSQNGAEGVVFNCVQNQGSGKSDVRTLKKNTKALFSDTTNFDWGELSATKLWADEAYTLCNKVCVPGASLGKKATKANAYMQHSARLAFAQDAPSDAGPVQNFLQSRFLPLINGWGAVHGNKNGTNGYGTYGLTTEQIRRLASLQTYAARAWVKPKNTYAGSRIGVRWVDRLDLGNGWNSHDRAILARRIARAIAGAYKPSGRALGACDPTGKGKTKLCQATVSGAKFTDAWATFRVWGNSTTTCNAAAPPNDDFANAQTLGSATSGSVEGTIECATWEQQRGETAQPEGTKSVWYEWTAPYDDYASFFSAYDSDGGLQTNVYTGDSLGGLSKEYGNFSGGCGVLWTTAGTHYMIQVVNTRADNSPAPTGAFTLHWGLGGCFN